MKVLGEKELKKRNERVDRFFTSGRLKRGDKKFLEKLSAEILPEEIEAHEEALQMYELKLKQVIKQAEDFLGIQVDDPRFLGLLKQREKETGALYQRFIHFEQAIDASKKTIEWKTAQSDMIQERLNPLTPGQPEGYLITMQRREEWIKQASLALSALKEYEREIQEKHGPAVYARLKDMQTQRNTLSESQKKLITEVEEEKEETEEKKTFA